MFMKKLFPFDKFKIPCSFNSSLYVVSLTKDPTDNKVTECYTLEEDKHFFLKEMIAGKQCSPEKNSRVINDAQTEVCFLREALQKKVNSFIVELIGTIDYGITNRGIILELAQCNFNDMYFEKTGSLITHDQFGGHAAYIKFLKHMETFFINVLEFLKASSLVYCDWKFDNILCFHINPKDDPQIKLSDFGSVLSANIATVNPHNINQLYCSPNLASCQKYITPQYSDDYKSVSFLFYKLNGKRLPWEIEYNVQVAGDVTGVLALTTLLKVMDLTKLKFKGLPYWPSDPIFNVLNTSAYYVLDKRSKISS